MVTSEKFRKVLTRFLSSTTSWFRDDIALVVSLC